MENESASLGYRGLFLHKAELAVIPTRSEKKPTKKKQQKQHLGHFPTKKTKQNKKPQNMPSTIHVSDREEKSYNTV